jgi:hypothetical protein
VQYGPNCYEDYHQQILLKSNISAQQRSLKKMQMRNGLSWKYGLL